MIKKIVLWYLDKVALKHCAVKQLCCTCPFGYENCECSILKVKKV